jgi:hypothetical protein
MRRTGLAAIVALTVVGCTSGSAADPSKDPTGPSPLPSASAADTTAAAMGSGPYPTTAVAYRLDDLRIAGLPHAVEVEGHVVGPTGAAGALPLVVFLHGYTASCYRAKDGSSTGGWPCPKGYRPIPNWRGFTYLQERLASQGYLTVSVSANGVNVQSGTSKGAGSGARAKLVHRHLEAWASGMDGMGQWQVDLDRVLLVGHSRGGEGMDAAVRSRPASAPWTVKGEVLMGPTEFAPAPTTKVPLVAFTGYCDGDVGPGAGQRYVDRPAIDPGLLRSSIILEGANHNFFNTEWDPATATVEGGYDDAFGEDGGVDPLCAPGSPTRLTAAAQQDTARQVLGIVAAALLRDEPGPTAVLDGRLAVPADASGPLRISAVGHGRTTWVPGADLHVAGTAGTRARLCQGISETEKRTACGYGTGEGQSVHWPDEYRGLDTPPAIDIRWSAPGGGAVLTSPAGPLDLSQAHGLEARIAVAPDGSPADLDLVLTDSTGATVVLPAEPLEAFPDGQRLPSRRWGQRFWAPIEGDVAVDLTSVVSLTLVPRSPNGHVWLVDVSVPPAG